MQKKEIADLLGTIAFFISEHLLGVALLALAVIIILGKKRLVSLFWSNRKQVAPIDKVIHQYVTFAIGLGLCVVMALIPTILTLNALEKYSVSWMFSIPVFVLLLGMTFTFVFYDRLEKLELNNHGVILFLGKPVFGTYVYGTGLNWKIPFTTVIPVDVSEKIVNFPSSSEEPGFSVTTLRESKNSSTGGKLALWVRVALRYKVACSVRFIMFENTTNQAPTGAKLIEELRNKIISVLRLIAAGLDDETFTRNKEVLGKSLLDGTDGDVIHAAADGIDDSTITFKTILDQNINAVSISNWGVVALECIISKVDPQSGIAKEAREKLFKEQNEKRAERVEFDHIRGMISELAADYMKDEGGKMKAEDAWNKATRVVMAQLDKIKTFDYDFGGKVGDFTKGAALQANQQQTKGK